MSNGLQQVINYMIPAIGTPRGYFWSGVLDAAPVNIDFRNVSGGGIDGQPFRPSGIFIDNTQGVGPVTVVINEISYQIVCEAAASLHLQFPAPVELTVSFVGDGQATIAFVDFPVLPFNSAGGGGGGMANPMTTAGDIIIGTVDGVPVRLPIGANGEVLTVTAGVPSWEPAGGGGGGSQLGIASAINSGQYYLAREYVSAVNAAVWTPASGETVFQILYLDAALTVSEMAAYVTTGVAASDVEIGIYEMLGAGKPGTCLGKATINTGSSFTIDSRVIDTSPLALAAGPYFLVLHSDTSTQELAGSEPTAGCYEDATALVTNVMELFDQNNVVGSVSIDDTDLPGGSYSFGMDLTGLEISLFGGAIVRFQCAMIGLKKA